MLEQIFSITRNTFLESIRQPIFSVLIFVGGLMLVFNPLLSAYTMDDDNKLLVDMGLSTLFIIGLVLAAFTATGVLSQEIENRTVLTVVSKPVARPAFIVGKFFGVAAALFVAYWTLAAVFLLSVRHQVMQTARDHFDQPVITFGLGAALLAFLLATAANYYYRRVFTSTFVLLIATLQTLAWVLVMFIDKQWRFQPFMTDVDPQLLLGIAMVFEAVLILAALAVAVSTRLGQVMTLALCAGFFMLGLVSDYLFGRDAVQEQFPWTQWLYLVIPNFQFLWPADALTQGHDITGGYFGQVTGYAGAYILALLGVAAALFQTREIE